MTMIPYYDELLEEEQQEVSRVIRLLLRQTFILEHKYERRTGRLQHNRDFSVCSRHLEFIREYFGVSQISLRENSQMGLIYIENEGLTGDKLPQLATLYLLALKLIYDEQMESISTSVNVYATLGQIHEKLGNCRLFKRQPSPTEIRRTVTLLKKYQLIEPLDMMEDLSAESRLMVYPSINAVLLGNDIRQLLAAFEEGEENDDTDEDD